MARRGGAWGLGPGVVFAAMIQRRSELTLGMEGSAGREPQHQQCSQASEQSVRESTSSVSTAIATTSPQQGSPIETATALLSVLAPKALSANSPHPGRRRMTKKQVKSLMVIWESGRIGSR